MIEMPRKKAFAGSKLDQPPSYIGISRVRVEYASSPAYGIICLDVTF